MDNGQREVCDNTIPIKHFNINALGGIAAIGVCLILIGIGPDNLMIFVDTPSLAIVAGIIAGAMSLGLGREELTRLPIVVKLCFFEPEYYPRLRNDSILLMQAGDIGFRSSVIGGTIGVLIGLINMLKAGMDDPNALCIGMAVALITLFYGGIGAIFFAAMRTRGAGLLCRLPQESSPEPDMAMTQAMEGTRSSSYPWIVCVATLFIMAVLLFLTIPRNDGGYTPVVCVENDTAKEWVVTGRASFISEDGKDTSFSSLKPQQLTPGEFATIKLRGLEFTMEHGNYRPNWVRLVVSDIEGQKIYSWECEWNRDESYRNYRISDLIGDKKIIEPSTTPQSNEPDETKKTLPTTPHSP